MTRGRRGGACGLDRELQFRKEHPHRRAELIVIGHLTKHFGPPAATVVERLCTASSADIDRWADAVLSAPTLDAVFGD